MKKIKKVISKLKYIMKNPALSVLPGEIAFFMFLSVFPIIMLIGVIASFFSVSMDSIIEIIEAGFPSSVVDLVIPLLSGKGIDINVIIFIVMGFILASNGAHAIIVASNNLYEFPNADWLRRRVKALIIILLIINLFIMTMIALAYGELILKGLISYIKMPNIAESLLELLIWLRWPIGMFLVYFNVKLIYVIAPDNKIKSCTTTKGAQFTTIGWVVATIIYSYYATNFSRYDLFYGGLSNIIILMIWIYALSYILVIGIAINVTEYPKLDKE